jgi:streptogramin lyase
VWGLHVGDTGETWMTTGSVHRLSSDDWEEVPLPDLGGDGAELALGSDGTAWLARRVEQQDPGEDTLARYDGGAWTVFGGDGIPQQGNARWGVPHQVGPDGAVWFPLKGDRECGGIGRFDGESWQAFLPGTCIYAFDVGADGRTWLLGSAIRWSAAGDDLLRVRPIETYLIDPGIGGDR